MENAYEAWRLVMYGVGVFVTCNAGGMILRAAFARMTRDADGGGSPARSDGGAPDYHGQSFEEMRREVERYGEEGADA